jgi:hypothetical protein
MPPCLVHHQDGRHHHSGRLDYRTCLQLDRQLDHLSHYRWPVPTDDPLESGCPESRERDPLRYPVPDSHRSDGLLLHTHGNDSLPLVSQDSSSWRWCGSSFEVDKQRNSQHCQDPFPGQSCLCSMFLPKPVALLLLPLRILRLYHVLRTFLQYWPLRRSFLFVLFLNTSNATAW